MPPKQPANKPSPQVTEQLPGLTRLFQSGDLRGAASGLVTLSSQAPNDARVFDMLSTVQALLAQREPAVVNARRALKLNGDDPQLIARCASVLQRAGEYKEALAHIERGVYRDPKSQNLLRLKVTLLTDIGNDGQALKALKALQKLLSSATDPNAKMGVTVLEARLAPATVDAREVVDRLDPLVHHASCADGFRRAGAFQLGRLQESLKEYDRAFKAYALGKTINKPHWDPDSHSARVDRLIECWSSPGIESSGIDGSRLVFIVGMMRSGTSLCEQMLAQCKEITPGDELSIVENTVSRIEDTPERVFASTRERYTAERIGQHAKLAMESYRAHFADSIGTDKQPENFYHLPLIVRLFPGCKIIHCKRDAMDCCVSNFVQSFAQTHPQTHDLAWLGRYHRDYQRVMQAWRALPEIEMLEINYEDLVSEPEPQTKRITDHIGITWTPEMLRFHESKRIVTTASREQVRSAINTRSIARHERFADHLGPLRDALANTGS